MPKINIKVSIINNQDNINYEVPAIIGDDKLKYREPDNTLVVFDYKNYTLTRENKKLKMTYIFEKDNETTGTYIVNELKKEMEIPIITKEIIINKNNIDIDFYIDSEENKFKYRIEEIE